MHTTSLPPSGQRFSRSRGSLGKHTVSPLTTGQLLLNIAGALVIAGTYAATVLVIGNELGDGTTVSLPLVGGYLLGVVLLLVGNLSRIPLSALALIPFAAAFNIVLGQVVGFSGIPLYLDAVATVLVAYLAGPAAGVLTGAITNLAWGLTINPTTIPFAAGAAMIGLLAGYAGRLGLLERVWTAVPTGFVVGVIAGMIGGPIAAFVYGGGLGVGTGSVVALLQAAGHSMLAATTLQAMMSDPLDKAITFLLVWAIAQAIPARVKEQLNTR